MTRVSYLTPFTTPAVGGASVYVPMLARGLLAQRACSSFTVITERHPDVRAYDPSDAPGLTVIRPYPYRAGRPVRDRWSYLAYAIQNLQFLGLARHARGSDVLFVHGSFLNNPGLLLPALRLLRRRRPRIAVVLDLRDPKFPETLKNHLGIFDAVISCSANISARLGQREKVYEIPILIDAYRPTVEQRGALARSYGLAPGTYVFNGSGLGRGKGIERALRLVSALRVSRPALSLVVVGKRRRWDKEFQSALDAGWLRLLGSIPRDHVRALSAASWLDVNLSSVDSFPRHSLEALASGAPVLFPPGIPELVEACPDQVASGSFDEVVRRAEAIAEGRLAPCAYDWRSHGPKVVIPLYEAVIRAAVERSVGVRSVRRRTP